MPVLDPPLTALAGRQAGLLTREQLLTAGWTDGRVRAAARRWPVVLPGVYLVSGAAPLHETQAMAAILRWPAAVLSHDTAARWRGWSVLDRQPLWPGLLDDEPKHDPDLVHVTCPTKLRPPAGYVVHRADAGPSVFVRSARLTDDARTALDIARTAPLPLAVPLLDAACRSDECLIDEVTSRLASLVGHHGGSRAHRVISLVRAGAESVLESLLRLLLSLAGLPSPQVQVPIRLQRSTYRADLAYPECRLAIEADGREYHSSWSAVSSDMARQNALVGSGWRVLRFTWRQVLYQPDLVIEAVRVALGK